MASPHQIVLSPLFSGLLLSAIRYCPNTLRNALQGFADKLPYASLRAAILKLDSPTTPRVLGVLLAIGLVRHLNRYLNIAASNAWRLSARKDWDWPNEIAVVTGGASGIGANITADLAAMGVRVAVLDVQAPPEKAVGADARVRFYECDVTSPESLAAAAEALRRDHGGREPSILVNNAGITKPVSILQMPYAFLRKIFGVNCLSHWLTVQQFMPAMIAANKGHIVTVASIASFVALPTASTLR